MVIDDGDIAFIPEAEHLNNPDTTLHRSDMVLSKTAYPAASLVTLDECNVSQDTVAVKFKPNSNLNSHCVVAFLNSRYGMLQMRRWFTGNIQMHLNLTDCKGLLIPKFSDDFQTQIKGLFEKSIDVKEQSKRLYAEAENLLLDELGLRDWQPPQETVAVKSFKQSFAASGRLDAEFYQPKYDELKAIITANAVSVFRIRDIQTFNQRGEQPRYVVNGDLKIINSRHILEQQLDYHNFERTTADEWDLLPLARIFKYDILIYTTGANVGRTNVYLKDERALASNHVNILRVKNANRIYVAFVLNSLVGRMQTKQIITGSAQAELYSNAIEQFIVPFVSDDAQQSISKAVENSYDSQRESKLLLETAKRAVEIAIETTEAAALEFIERAGESDV